VNRSRTPKSFVPGPSRPRDCARGGVAFRADAGCRERRDCQLWCKKVEAVSAAGHGRWTVRHKPVPLRPPLTLTLEQLEAIPPRLLRLREEDETSVFEVTYRLQPGAQGTRLTQVSEFRWKRLPHLLQRVLARGVQRDVRGQLRDLRRVLETS
jgi:hypothetical protein